MTDDGKQMLDLTKAPWVERRPENQFYGYHISFEPTGCDAVDTILKAVALAAKGYHETEFWGDDRDGGPSYLEWIQAAAEDAARKFAEMARLAGGAQ